VAPTIAQQFESFLAKYSPPVQSVARQSLVKLRKLLPGATELVYDNYNALVIGFGPSERASEAIVSIALYSKWVNLYFLRGAGLNDPEKLLLGSGSTVRRIRLDAASVLDEPPVRALIAQAVARAHAPLVHGSKRRMVIRAVAAKQRGRQPL
jgi:hypothetical protein